MSLTVRSRGFNQEVVDFSDFKDTVDELYERFLVPVKRSKWYEESIKNMTDSLVEFLYAASKSGDAFESWFDDNRDNLENIAIDLAVIASDYFDAPIDGRILSSSQFSDDDEFDFDDEEDWF